MNSNQSCMDPAVCARRLLLEMPPVEPDNGGGLIKARSAKRVAFAGGGSTENVEDDDGHRTDAYHAA
jgi:hypothetical protein